MKAGYPFNSVRVYPAYGQQQATIAWSLDQNFEQPPPYQFYVEKSGVGTDGWEPVNAEPVVNLLSAVDSCVGMFNKDYNLFYRVRLVCHGVEYISLGQGLFGSLSRDEFLVAREIMRRHFTQMRHRGGSRCFILIRKKRGRRCQECTDPIGGQVVAANVCTNCFGTGIEGGYETPVLTYAMVTDGKYELKQEGEALELSGKMPATVETIGFPILTRGDIIVKTETDERYDVQVTEQLDIHSFPVAQNCGCAKLPVTDIVYKFATPSEQYLPDPVPHGK